MHDILELLEVINHNPNKNNVLELFNFIKNKDYSEIFYFYKKNKNKYLYRGSKINKNVYLSKPKDLRIPKDSSIINHILYDEILQSLNFKARRTNSIFCTPSFSVAKNYGNVYVIFPKNGFNYLYSEKIQDLYLYNVHKLTNIFIKKYKNSFYIKSDNDVIFFMLKDDKKQEAIKELIKIFKLDPNKENYYMSVDIYFLINYIENKINEKNKKDFLNWLSKYAENGLKNKKIFDFYKSFFKKTYKDTNLEDAFKNEKIEIMISCDNFIAIDYKIIMEYGFYT